MARSCSIDVVVNSIALESGIVLRNTPRLGLSTMHRIISCRATTISWRKSSNRDEAGGRTHSQTLWWDAEIPPLLCRRLAKVREILDIVVAGSGPIDHDERDLRAHLASEALQLVTRPAERRLVRIRKVEADGVVLRARVSHKYGCCIERILERTLPRVESRPVIEFFTLPFPLGCLESSRILCQGIGIDGKHHHQDEA